MAQPSDFHLIKARLSIPMAPAFLPPLNRRSLYAPPAPPSDSDSDSVSRLGLHNPPIPHSAPHTDAHKPNQPPSPCRKPSGGAHEALNQTMASLLMKYLPSLGCVVLSYQSPPKFLFDQHSPRTRPRRKAHPNHRPSRSATSEGLPMMTVSGFAWSTIHVEVKLLGWRPQVGQTLIGRTTHSSPDHLSLIVYQTFNASIASHHLTPAGYSYDPNLQAPQSWAQRASDPGQSSEAHENLGPSLFRHSGCWVDPHGMIVGGRDGVVSFTVVSLTVANNMISVVGSLLPDLPSSTHFHPHSQPTHQPDIAPTTTPSNHLLMPNGPAINN